MASINQGDNAVERLDNAVTAFEQMTNRTTLGRIWAESGQRVDPDEDGIQKYSQGWLAEIPSYEVLNFLQWRVDIALTALAERGIPEWGNDIGYLQGALAWDNSNNTVYRAKVNSPSRGLAPSANLSQWEPSAIQISSLQWTTANNKINTHIARTDNPHGVTAEQVNTYIKSVIDNKIAAVNTTISNHIANTNDPHDVTAAQAGAVPITGGAYTGAVTFSTEETKINPAAGDQAVFGNATMVGIRAGTTRFGIRKSDNRLVRTQGAVTDIMMNETEYVAKRRTIEKDYTPPVCDMVLDLLTDINLRVGYGFSHFTRPSTQSYTNKAGSTASASIDVPRFTLAGMALEGSKTEKLVVGATYNWAGFPTATLFFEGSVDLTKGIASIYKDNSGKADEVLVAANGDVLLRVQDSSAAIREFKAGTVVSGQVFKFALTWDGTGTFKTFLNGVEGQGSIISFAPTAGYTQIIMGDRTTGLLYCRKLQTWATNLSPEKISTL